MLTSVIFLTVIVALVAVAQRQSSRTVVLGTPQSV